MKSLNIILWVVVVQTVGCLSPPSVSVSTSLRRHDLKGKTLAVGGFTAQNLMDYPGQTAEETIVRDAGTALQKRLKHSRVITAEAAWAAAGPPPLKISGGVPINIGHKLNRDFLRRTRALGVDYLLWIDLLENTVRDSSSQRVSKTRTASSYSTRNGKRYSTPGTTSNTYYSYEAAGRRLGASYSLLDTASGRTVWCADIKFTRGRMNSSMSMSGFPEPPARPLPPEDSTLMQKMTEAAMAVLPK